MVHGVAEADVRKVLPHLSRQVQTIIELLWLTGFDHRRSSTYGRARWIRLVSRSLRINGAGS